MTTLEDARTPAPARLRKRFAERFGNAGARPLAFASAPGRVELAGNHTDHQGGRTISAAIDRRIYALAAPNGTDEMRVSMEIFGDIALSCGDLDARESERGTSLALVRGMAAAFVRAGGRLSGFDAATCSDIPAGAGVSSSAAFEMLVGVLLRVLCDPTGAVPCDPVALALEGAQVEQAYFGKPCGVQDQLASAQGGAAAFDFAGDLPRVEPIAFDWEACGYALCLVDSRCDHSVHADEYAAVPADMRAVARRFGCERLEDVPYPVFLARLADVRAHLGDRAALRALHYFEETRRVAAQQRALESGDIEGFLEGVRQSGASSAQFLQNVSPRGDGLGARQPAMMVLALCAHLLDGRGAYRIHGGGFGGSALAFVPAEDIDAFCESMDALLGYDACLRAKVDGRGAYAERMA